MSPVTMVETEESRFLAKRQANPVDQVGPILVVDSADFWMELQRANRK